MKPDVYPNMTNGISGRVLIELQPRVSKQPAKQSKRLTGTIRTEASKQLVSNVLFHTHLGGMDLEYVSAPL